MQLLVSVQNAEEARAACAGGAGIIDAKDPGRGALGPVARVVLREIRDAVAADVPVSAALGDVASPSELEQALSGLPDGLAFIKLGFRGVAHTVLVGELLADAVKCVSQSPPGPRVVAVAYADWREVGGLAPEAFPAIIERAGAHGLLVDTALKDGRTLPDHLPADDLIALGSSLSVRGLTYALGGSLTPRDIPLARASGAGIIGVRGAVTVGGRAGAVDVARVAAFASAVRASAEPSLR